MIIFNVYHTLRSYEVWVLIHGVQQTEFFVILDHFLPFYPPNPENQNFQNNGKTHKNIIILPKST